MMIAFGGRAARVISERRGARCSRVSHSQGGMLEVGENRTKIGLKGTPGRHNGGVRERRKREESRRVVKEVRRERRGA